MPGKAASIFLYVSRVHLPQAFTVCIQHSQARAHETPTEIATVPLPHSIANPSAFLRGSYPTMLGPIYKWKVKDLVGNASRRRKVTH